MLGSKCAPGLNLSRPGYRNPQSGTLICWANFLHYLAFTVTSSPTLTSLSLAVEQGLTLCSTDGDFARFQGLRWLIQSRPEDY
jgi:hypothetical protein